MKIKLSHTLNVDKVQSVKTYMSMIAIWSANLHLLIKDLKFKLNIIKVEVANKKVESGNVPIPDKIAERKIILIAS